MNTYIFLLDQMSHFFQSKFSNLPMELQDKLNQKGIDRPHIGISADVSKWDELSPLQREYLAALYDFYYSPNKREKTVSEKLLVSVTPYLKTIFSDLPPQIKMDLAYVDIFQLWNEISIEQRKYMACDFDNRMQATYRNSENIEFLIEYFNIKKKWDKFALQRELLAEEAIPLMHGCDPDSWEEYEMKVKCLPEDMIRSIKRYLKIAQADGLTKYAPSQWLIWGRFHDLDKLIIESFLGNSESEVCMWDLFESAVNDYLKNHSQFQDSPKEQKFQQMESVSLGRKINKLRRNILDPAIEEAIKRAKTTKFPDVYLQLKELAKDEYPPFSGAFEGDALCYTNENDIEAKLSKHALRTRLNRRRQ